MADSHPAAPRALPDSDVQRATFNILEDLHEERARFDDTQRATFNILDDLQAERDRLEATQQATLNILEDFDAEKQKVARSLAEKEILLREIHHRVKNNLQVIASLLTLQSKTLDEGPARAGLIESHDRVLSMALVHETLYRGRDLARVDFGEYARALCQQVDQASGASARGIGLVVDIAEETFLPIDAAVPLGLIVNELVTNAFKHAFPSGRKGRVVVQLRRTPDAGHEFAVFDDGAGAKPGVDVTGANTLGLRLVRGLARQLSATFDITLTPSVRVTLRLPPPPTGAAGATRPTGATS